MAWRVVALAAIARAQTPGCGPSSSWSAGWNRVDYTFNGTSYRHTLRIPSNYDSSTPAPLLLYFHGWGANGSQCSDYCELAADDYGFIAAGVTGAGPAGWSSWNGAGTTGSPGSDGATCAPGTTGYCNRYVSCGGDCADNCWWTTCEDSVKQAMDLLDYLESELCVNTSMVWASGCSNGGVFTFELAQDSRSAPRLAGIAPQVGLPHNGFNFGPSTPMHLFGMWGLGDTKIPPISNTDDPGKSFDTSYSGWYYSTSRNTTDRWGDVLGCDARIDVTDRWLIGNYGKLDASSGAGVGCTARLGGHGGAEVVECVMDAGHVCGEAQWVRNPMLAFMSTHPQILASTPSSTPSVASTETLTISVQPAAVPVLFPRSAPSDASTTAFSPTVADGADESKSRWAGKSRLPHASAYIRGSLLAAVTAPM